jgi:UDP-glucose 4-epimerase
MRALITGGAGFIGSHLVDALVARGDEVTVVDDCSKGRPERLTDVALERVDIRDGEALTAVAANVQPEVIFHLAAQADVRVSVARPTFDAEVNVLGTINVLEAARRHDARVVFASTGGALYGETDNRPTPEDAPLAPEAPYGTAKACAEEYLALWNRLHGTRHVALRLGNVYGPRQDPAGEAGVVSIFAGRFLRHEAPTIFGDGRQTRDYVYVGDVVDAFVAASALPEGGRFNVGTGVETSVLDLVEGLARLDGGALSPEFAPARPGELQASSLDAGALRAATGWEPRIDIDEGLKRVWAWVQAGEPARGAR